RDAERASSSRPRAARDADEPAAAAQYGPLRRGGRDDPAGDAGVLPAAEDARRPRRLHGRQDSVGPRLRARAVSRLDRPGTPVELGIWNWEFEIRGHVVATVPRVTRHNRDHEFHIPHSKFLIVTDVSKSAARI